jgi:EAL domain-containing protein (putative c-di-GMP-specific phosphodiesterase class I)
MQQPMYRSMLEKMVEFARGSEIEVIGEGVETAETVEMLHSVGVHLMQGWHFGKPSAQMVREISRDLVQLGSAVSPEIPQLAKLTT